MAARAPEFLSERGEHVLQWNPGPLGSGIYFLRLSDPSGLSASARLVIVP